MINESHFRDGKVISVSVNYDWEEYSAFAVITIDRYGVTKTYKIHGLTEFHIFDDLTSAYIEQCTLVTDNESIYLCLDPYMESKPTGKDNYYFKGKSIVQLT